MRKTPHFSKPKKKNTAQDKHFEIGWLAMFFCVFVWGRAYGGHLLEGCKIFTTAEIVLLEIKQMTYKREMDKETGFPELVNLLFFSVSDGNRRISF